MTNALLTLRAAPVAASTHSRSALVFAPHPDDETLGCGGTILKRRAAGADVGIVFLTDGSGSHPRLMAARELKAIRAQEARAAAEVLGLAPDDLFFLDYPDGDLRDHARAAVARVGEILDERLPDDVFVTHSEEAPTDHWVTHRIVHAALRRHRRRVLVYEYAVWLWNHWPWVKNARPRLSKQSILSGLRMMRDLRFAVDVRDVLDRKRAALQCHASQMTRRDDDPRWLTLHDVGAGQFLECFFRPFELFYRHPVP